MSISAYVFVACKKPRDLVSHMLGLPGVLKVDTLLGEAQLVVVIQEQSFESLQGVLSKVQKSPGVRQMTVRLAA